MGLENDFGGLPHQDDDELKGYLGDEFDSPYCENCGSCGESGCCSSCCEFCGLYTDVPIIPLDKEGKLGYSIFRTSG